MSAENFEAFLARLYVDPEARARFLADPHGETRNAGLSEDERAALIAIDRDGLEFAARSFAAKRTTRETHRDQGSWVSPWVWWISARFKTIVKNLKPTLIVSSIGVVLCLGVYVGLKRYARSDPGISADTELQQGTPIIARIRLNEVVTHWVLIGGKEGVEYLIMDPLNDAKQLIRLSERSKKIHAIRVLRKVEPPKVESGEAL